MASSSNRHELAETFKNLAKLASCSRDNALSLLPFGHRSKGGLASVSPPLHSKRTVQNIVERKQVIGTLYRRGSHAVNKNPAKDFCWWDLDGVVVVVCRAVVDGSLDLSARATCFFI